MILLHEALGLIMVCVGTAWLTFLVFTIIEEVKQKKCERCGTPLILDHKASKGTIVKFSSKGQEIIHDADIPFDWLYYVCPNCNWGLCIPSNEKIG